MAGMVNYLYGGDPRRSVKQYLAAMFQASGHRFSWDYAWVAEADGEAAGCLFSYPGQLIGRLQWAFLRSLPALYGLGATVRIVVRSLPLYGTKETEADEYYISNISIRPHLQGRGIGAQLILFAEQKALQAGLSKCSLTVDEGNPGALRLYQRLGYKIVSSQRFNGEVAGHESGYHRLVKTLDACIPENQLLETAH